MKMPDSEQLNRDDYLLITDSWREEWEKGVQVYQTDIIMTLVFTYLIDH